MSTDSWRADWLMVAASFVMLAVIYAVWYSFAVFLVALGKDLSWSRSALSGAFSVFMVVQSLAIPAVGVMVDRFAPRLVMRVGALLIAAGLIAAGWVTEIWHFYLSFGLVAGMGVAAAGWTPIVVALSRRFETRMGLALGMASAGIAMGLLVVVPLCQYFILSFGWRTAYLLLGLIIFFVCQLMTFLVRSDRKQSVTPEERITPGATGDASGAHPAGALERPDWTVRAAVGTRSFWLFFAAFFAIVFATQLVMVHQVAYLVDVGYPEMFAASIIGLVGLVSIPGKIGWGTALDRFGREITFSAGCIATIVAVVVLIWLGSAGSQISLAYLYGFVFSLGYAMTGPLPGAITADLFPGRHFGSIWGVMYLSAGFASAFGPLFAGYVFDATGSYLVAFYLAMALSAVAGVLIWLVKPSRRRVSLALDKPT